MKLSSTRVVAAAVSVFTHAAASRAAANDMLSANHLSTLQYSIY